MPPWTFALLCDKFMVIIMNYLFRCADCAPSCGVPSCWLTCSLCCNAYCLHWLPQRPSAATNSKGSPVVSLSAGQIQRICFIGRLFQLFDETKINARSAIIRSLLELFSLNILFTFYIFLLYFYFYFYHFFHVKIISDTIWLYSSISGLAVGFSVSDLLVDNHTWIRPI